MRAFYLAGILAILVIGAASCGEDEPPFNPFDDPTLQPPPEDTTDTGIVLDPTSLAGLHQTIFKPVCANSGCHDGSFEPEFRTIESSYNTLVNHDALKLDISTTITKRVVPGNPDQSMLMYRLTQFLPNSSGIMPLQVEPDSDWNEKKDEYINNIRTWILNGAPDEFE